MTGQQQVDLKSLSLPTHFGTSRDEEISDWMMRFDTFAAALGWVQDAKKISMLAIHFEGTADGALRNLRSRRAEEREAAVSRNAELAAQVPPGDPIPVPAELTWPEVREHITAALTVVGNDRVNQSRFNQRKQNATESIADFAWVLKRLARKGWPKISEPDIERLTLQRLCEGARPLYRPFLLTGKFQTLG